MNAKIDSVMRTCERLLTPHMKAPSDVNYT